MNYEKNNGQERNVYKVRKISGIRKNQKKIVGVLYTNKWQYENDNHTKFWFMNRWLNEKIGVRIGIRHHTYVL
jgi:hypothetical protein